MRFEADPQYSDSNRTTVIFETADELNRASMLGSLSLSVQSYFGVAADSVEPVPIPGAVADENGRVLPSRTETPISNKRLIKAADRILRRSVKSPDSFFYQDIGPAVRSADQAFADAIKNHFGIADADGLHSAEADAS